MSTMSMGFVLSAVFAVGLGMVFWLVTSLGGIQYEMRSLNLVVPILAFLIMGLTNVWCVHSRPIDLQPYPRLAHASYLLASIAWITLFPVLVNVLLGVSVPAARERLMAIPITSYAVLLALQVVIIL